MKLYVPHTRLQPATAIWLAEIKERHPRFDVRCVDVSDNPWSYPQHFAQRWIEGEDFLNLEHDVVPWPGAADSLADCKHPWCFFSYLPGIDTVANGCAVFGFFKIAAEVIAATPGLWQQMNDTEFGRNDCPWRYCDIFFYRQATSAGFTAHQHHPAVLNANPNVLDWLEAQDLPVSCSTPVQRP